MALPPENLKEKRSGGRPGARNEQLWLALDASRMGVWDWDIETDRVSFSDRVAEIFGLTAGEDITWTALRERIHSADRDAVVSAVDKALADQAAYQIEYRVRAPSMQEDVWVFARGRVVRDSLGRPTGMFGIVEDITARKHAEQREKLLAGEVDHRAKNVMSVVQALIRLVPFKNRDQYVTSLSGRVNALARSHSPFSEQVEGRPSIGYYSP